jgi:hypothetical protein
MRSGASVLIVLALVLTACGGDSAGSGDTVAGTDGANAETTVAQSESESEESSDGAAESGPTGPGSATLTVGDTVYSFDNYYCLQGGDNTGNDSVPFSSGAFGEVDERRAQLDASIYDPTGGDRMEGDGVIGTVSLNDIEDFENPVVALTNVASLMGEPVTFEYDGNTLRVETTFDDDTTDEIEDIPGVLEATCGG